MEMTRGKLKEIIREEVDRMTRKEDSSAGKELAEKLMLEFNSLPTNDRQVFLSRFVKFLNEETS